MKTDTLTDSQTDYLVDKLYNQRATLFAVLCNSFYPLAWKAKKHPDGEEVYGGFMAGIRTPRGVFYLLCDHKHWDSFQVIERECMPEHDWLIDRDIYRLHSLNDEWEEVADMLAGVSLEDIDYGYDAAEFGV